MTDKENFAYADVIYAEKIFCIIYILYAVANTGYNCV